MAIKSFVPGADNSLGIIKDIRAEFGGTPGFAQDGRVKPAKMSEYYRYPNGRFVADLRPQNLSIPFSGTIKHSDFFGTASRGIPQIEFPNASFEQGLLGWTVLNRFIKLNGQDTILGFPTPTDPNPRPVNAGGSVSPGDVGVNQYPYSGQPRFVGLSTADVAPGGGATSLKMNTGSAIVPNGGLIYGPGFHSNQPVFVEKGTILTFYWRAVSDARQSVGDAYNIFAYMLNAITGQTLTLLRTNADRLGYVTSWQKYEKTFTAAERGIYYFVFIAGSFDTTFGTVVGSLFYLDTVVLNNRVLYE